MRICFFGKAILMTENISYVGGNPGCAPDAAVATISIVCGKFVSNLLIDLFFIKIEKLKSVVLGISLEPIIFLAVF